MSMPAASAADSPARHMTDMASEVRTGIARGQRKMLPSVYLWDEVGSALFEAITLLPEYGLGRAGGRLLDAHAEALIAHLRMPVAVAELGSGTARNTRRLLAALCRRQPTEYAAIEVSSWAAERCRAELGGIPSLRVQIVARSYLHGLAEVVRRTPRSCQLLVLFLGSTIGNFERAAAEAFLGDVRELLRPDDALLLGADLQQSEEALLQAYDDTRGVTAAFNLNLLARVNHDLDGDFDLGQFAHRAVYNPSERRIEMYLVSKRPQRVRLRAAGLDIALQEGEAILTEYSHKFNAAEVRAMAERAGYACVAQWCDTLWPFAHTLLRPISAS